MIDKLDFNLETYQTIAFGIAMLCLGVWFGNRVTGQLAYQEQMVEVNGIGIVTEQPDWVATVQSINQAVLAIFVICMVVVLAADYYSRDEEERPTLEFVDEITDRLR